jgi:plasmid stabilization system protein ParE
MGTAAEALAPGLRRFPHQRHTVYYRPQDGEVLIVRVLHASRDVNPEQFTALEPER